MSAPERYGSLKEGVHVAGYTLERAWGHLEWLLESDRWRSIGFDDVNAFLDSIQLDSFRVVAEQRKRIACRIKELQPAASNRQIAKTIGVSGKTVDRDVATNVAPDQKKPNNNKDARTDVATNVAPGLSGGEAAKTVARAERIAGQQNNTEERVARIQLDARKLGKFSLILADPPWDDEFGRSDRSVENHYPTMKLDEICALPVSQIAHDQALLFLWATPAMLLLAAKVVSAWGFEYRTHMVWVKPSIGLGKYVRQRHELLLICRRGDHPAPEAETLSDSVVEAPRAKHSAKPEIFHQIIERMYPTAERIELFRRGTSRAGWAAWGNELTGKADPDDGWPELPDCLRRAVPAAAE